MNLNYGAGQPVTCRASVNCAGGPGDDLGVAVDGRSCCLDNPSALAYSPQGTEECVACVGECMAYEVDVRACSILQGFVIIDNLVPS